MQVAIIVLVGCGPRRLSYDEIVIKPLSGPGDERRVHFAGDSTHSRYAHRRFEVDPRRTVVAIDLDDCVIRTRYDVAVFHRFDDVSGPFENARPTVTSIAETCQIIYVSARPWFYYPGTRYWLEKHGFPSAPIVHSTHLWNLVAQRRYKRKAMHEMQQDLPNLLVGIGDRGADIAGYRANNMLAIIVNSRPPADVGRDAIFVADWSGVSRIFEQNRAALSDPDSVRAVLRGDILLSLPLFRY